MILNGLENMRIHYYLNIMNLKRLKINKITLQQHMKLSAQIRHAYELLSEGKRTCVCTHIQRPHKCTWSVKGVCAYGCLPVKLLEPVSLCITSSASWHFPTVSKLGDREASEASSKASSLQKDRGKNQAVNQKGGSLYYTEQTSWCNTREQIT